MNLPMTDPGYHSTKNTILLGVMWNNLWGGHLQYSVVYKIQGLS